MNSLFFNVSGELLFRANRVSSIHHKSGTILPDRYKIGMLLQNESRIVCYSSGNTVWIFAVWYDVNSNASAI